MITAVIVWGSLFGALAFCIAYLCSPRLRAQVEQPKYRFHQQVQDFDKNAALAREPARGSEHESE